MGSREKDEATPHHPLLSSLVVRPTDSSGAGTGTGTGTGSDYEPGEVRRSDHGYRMRAGSTSPVRRRNADHRYSPEFDHSGGPTTHSRGFGRGRDPGRYREYSPPPYGRGRDGGRFSRGYGGPGLGPGPFRGEGGMPRSNPNVRPREGDWICPDPSCNNLNFARREYCNNCNRSRYGAGGGSPPPLRRGGYPMPPPPRRFPGPPSLDDRSPPPHLGRTTLNGYRSPPHRGWGTRDGHSPPHSSRHGGGRFPPEQHHHMRRDYVEEEDFRGDRNMSRFDRPLLPPLDYRGRDLPSERKGRGGYERRPPLSPPLSLPPPPPPHRGGRWGSRERSRSPPPLTRGRGGDGPPPKDYRRDIYMERGRDDRRGGGMGRDRIGDAY